MVNIGRVQKLYQNKQQQKIRSYQIWNKTTMRELLALNTSM